MIPSHGGQARRITFDSALGGSPVWMPDGRFIFYSAERAGSLTLFRVPTAGGAVEPVLIGSGEDTDPDISRDGRKLKHHTYAVRGTADNPMTREEVADKAYNLAEPVLGRRKARSLVATVLTLENVADVRSLRTLLRK